MKKTVRILLWAVLCVAMLALPAAAGTTTYEITFNNNGGVGGPGRIVKTCSSSTYSCMVSYNKPRKDGYVFLGWNTRPDGEGEQYRCGARLCVPDTSRRITLYAKWRKGNGFTLHYYPNGGVNQPAETVMVSSRTYNVPVQISSVAPVRRGYTFAGWGTEKEGLGKFYTPRSTVTFDRPGEIKLYAVWRRHATFLVNFQANGGTGAPSAVSVTSDQDSATITIPSTTPTRRGYTFLYWNTREDGSGANFAPGRTVTRKVSDPSLTLFAKWKADLKTYTLKLDACGGKMKADSVTKQTTAEEAEVKIPAAAPEREGYLFKGWYTGKNGSGDACKTGGTYTLTMDHPTKTLYAYWDALPKITYTLHYDTQGGTWSQPRTVVRSSRDGYYDFVIPMEDPVREGYNFLFWNFKADGSGVSNHKGNTIELEAKKPEATLYAQWKKKISPSDPDVTPAPQQEVTYTLKYVFADGSASSIDKKVRTTDATYRFTVETTAALKKDSTFTGWNTKKDGSGSPYQPGQVVTLKAASPSVTLYDQHKKTGKYKKVHMYHIDSGRDDQWIYDGKYIKDPNIDPKRADNIIGYRTLNGVDYLDSASFGITGNIYRDAGTTVNLSLLCDKIHKEFGMTFYNEGSTYNPIDWPLASFISFDIIGDPLNWYIDEYGLEALRQFKTATSFYEYLIDTLHPDTGHVTDSGKTLTKEQNLRVIRMVAQQLDEQYGCWDYALYGNAHMLHKYFADGTQFIAGCNGCGHYDNYSTVVCGEADAWMRVD